MDDFDRPLARRGLRAARKIGAFISENDLMPEYCLCSSAKRARQTWEVLVGSLQQSVAIEFREDLYMADREEMRSIIADASPARDKLMLIGHEPGIGALAQSLVGSGDIGAISEFLGPKYPTGGLAAIRFDERDWSRIGDQSGYLSHFVHPRRLKLSGKTKRPLDMEAG